MINSNLIQKNGNAQNNLSKEPVNRSWIWSWDPKHGKNFSILNILNDKESETGITFYSLRHVLKKESDALNY